MAFLAVPEVRRPIRASLWRVGAPWLDVLTDWQQLWGALCVAGVTTALSFAAGVCVAVGLNWQIIKEYTQPQPVAERPLVIDAVATAEVAVVPQASTEIRLAPPPAAETVVASVPTPVLMVAPTSDEAWLALQQQLDAAWGVNTPRTVSLLSDFASRFPERAAARDKLYVALLASADELAGAGETQAAIDQLTRAADLASDRPEAREGLRALTESPTPAPVVDANPAAPPHSAAPAPPRTAAPPIAPQVNAARAAPQVAAPPTPTKVPFQPPVGP